jgi:ELP3 family radical SAM enzyme/protein acetyltransferase
MVITVLTSPYPTYKKNGKIKKQRFSCKHGCYYCPNEPGQPRSYLKNEPAVARANRNEFNPINQFNDRANTYYCVGHPVDKIELLVLGGTWSEYPIQYQEEFVRDLFYAANVFYDNNPREPLSLIEEQKINETAKCKIIGLTLETRPDSITPDEIKRFRYYGCTRVQIGVQHTNDELLRIINRGCYLEDTIRAIKLLKDSCYKIDIHLMPDLPFSTPELDNEMFDMVLDSPDLQVDQWKIYPCEVVPWTIIKKWHNEGEYESYGEEKLIEVILNVKRKVHPWIRLNRVIRDIPNEYISGGNDITNLRQYLIQMLKDRGEKCKCIRCREIKDKNIDPNTAKLIVRTYPASDGTEYFISYETPDEDTIFGFVRLRLVKNSSVDFIPEIEDAALIRELHIYGNMNPVFKFKNDDSKVQHAGFGKRLMKKAEEIAISQGYKKIVVISGIGVKNYYRKLGYKSEGTFMVKSLKKINLCLSFLVTIIISISLKIIINKIDSL